MTALELVVLIFVFVVGLACLPMIWTLCTRSVRCNVCRSWRLSTAVIGGARWYRCDACGYEWKGNSP